MFLLTALMIFGGLVLLVAGGEGLVRGAVALANRLQVPPLVIGLTIVAYGTSMPEMVVSLQSTMSGHPDIALGNVIGSNISNILLILGVTALIFPITMDRDLASRDGMVMLMVALLLLMFCEDGTLSRMEGGILLAIAIFHGVYTLYSARTRPSAQLEKELEEETNISLPLWLSSAYIAGGLVLLVFGGNILVEGCVTLARNAGISEAVIGLTIVAIGTSLPELMASAIAAWRRHPGICLGNIVGSNLMNTVLILGVTPVIAPITVAPQFVEFDIWFMIGCSLALVAFLLNEKKMGRLEGIALLLCFLCYLMYQSLRALAA